MTTSAADIDREKNLRRGRGEIIKLVIPSLFGIGRLIVPRSDEVVAEANLRLGRQARDRVASDLLSYELCKRLVFVQRADDIVPIPPGERLIGISFVAIRVGIANQVEPMPRPALPVPGIFEKRIYPLVEGGVARQPLKLRLLLGCGWQADDREKRSPKNRCRQRWGGRSDPQLLDFSQDERSMGFGGPTFGGNIRERRKSHRFERPVASTAIQRLGGSARLYWIDQ